MKEQNLLQEFAVANNAVAITVTTPTFIWLFEPFPAIKSAKVITTGFVAPRKHLLSLEEAEKALADPEYANQLHQAYQDAHNQKWSAYYKEWRNNKTPDEREDMDERRRAYQRKYNRNKRAQAREERTSFEQRGN